MKQDIEYYYKWLQAFFSYYGNAPQSEELKNAMKEVEAIVERAYKERNTIGLRLACSDMKEMTRSPRIQHKVGFCISLFNVMGERNEKQEQQIAKFFSKPSNLKNADNQVPYQQWLEYLSQFS